MEYIYLTFKDFEAGRLLESLIFLAVLWFRLKPHLTKIEARMAGLEDAVKLGFNSGELKFNNLENRISVLERVNHGKESVRPEGIRPSYQS